MLPRFDFVTFFSKNFAYPNFPLIGAIKQAFIGVKCNVSQRITRITIWIELFNFGQYNKNWWDLSRYGKWNKNDFVISGLRSYLTAIYEYVKNLILHVTVSVR